MNADLDIVPAINKIDLPSAHPEEVKVEIEDELAIPADDAVCVSGKTGEGIHDLLEAIVFLVSPPKGDADKPLKALILDPTSTSTGAWSPRCASSTVRSRRATTCA